MKKLSLILIFCLGCHFEPDWTPKYNVGQKVKFTVNGNPAIITHVNMFDYTYYVKYSNDLNEIQYMTCQEFELEE